MIAPALWSPEMFLTVVAVVLFGSVGLVAYAAVMDARANDAPPAEDDPATGLLAFGEDDLVYLGLAAAEEAQEEISEGAVETWRSACEREGINLPPVIADEEGGIAAVTDEELEGALAAILLEHEASEFENWNSDTQCCVDGLWYELESRGKDAAFFFEWIEENIGLEMLWKWYTTGADTSIATGCAVNSLLEILGEWIREKCPDWLCT